MVIISIIRGSILRWLIFPTPCIVCLPIKLKLLTLFVCIIGGLIGYIISLTSLFFYNKSLYNNKLIRILSLIWFMPIIFTTGIIKLPLLIGRLVKEIDQGWREYFGARNLFNYIKKISIIYQIIYLNSLKLYLLRFLLWIFFLLIFTIKFYLNSLYRV